MNITSLLDKVYTIFINNTETLTKAPLSLYNGKSGHALFLYHLADYKESEEIFMKADDIMTSMLSKIGDLHVPYFSTGQIGVGWMLQYLKEEGFITTHPITFRPFDETLFKQGLSGKSFFLHDGILGMCIYCWSRQESIIVQHSLEDNSLVDLQQRSFFIQLIDRLQFDFDNYMKQMELFTPVNVIRYETVSLYHLLEFTNRVLPVYYFMQQVHEQDIIRVITNSFILQLEAIIENIRNVLCNKQGQTDMLDIEGYYFALTTLMLPAKQQVLPMTILEEENNQRAWITTALKHKSVVSFMYSAVAAFHETGNSIFKDLALRIAEQTTDAFEQQPSQEQLGLEKGLSGIGLSLLALQEPNIRRWAGSIGFN